MNQQLENIDEQKRNAVVRAAEVYDETQRIIQDQGRTIEKQAAALEAQLSTIRQLELVIAQERAQHELALATERNHVQSYKTERDDAIRESARLEALLAHHHGRIQGLLRDYDDAGIPLPGKARRRNGSGKFVAASEPDTLVADIATAVASPPVERSEVPDKE